MAYLGLLSLCFWLFNIFIVLFFCFFWFLNILLLVIIMFFCVMEFFSFILSLHFFILPWILHQALHQVLFKVRLYKILQSKVLLRVRLALLILFQLIVLIVDSRSLILGSGFFIFDSFYSSWFLILDSFGCSRVDRVDPDVDPFNIFDIFDTLDSFNSFIHFIVSFFLGFFHQAG